MKSHPIRTVLPASGLILLSACLLGTFFNAASPLGVRMLGADEDPGTHQSQFKTPASSYHNETVALSIEAGLPPGSAAHAEAIVGPSWPQLKAMTWHEVKGLLAEGRIILVDAREQASFDAGHIPGAVSLPSNFTPDQINSFLHIVPKNTPVVVYCANSECPASRRLAGILRQQYGFVNVRDMPGGYVEWRVAQLATGVK